MTEQRGSGKDVEEPEEAKVPEALDEVPVSPRTLVEGRSRSPELSLAEVPP